MVHIASLSNHFQTHTHTHYLSLTHTFSLTFSGHWICWVSLWENLACSSPLTSSACSLFFWSRDFDGCTGEEMIRKQIFNQKKISINLDFYFLQNYVSYFLTVWRVTLHSSFICYMRVKRTSKIGCHITNLHIKNRGLLKIWEEVPEKNAFFSVEYT